MDDVAYLKQNAVVEEYVAFVDSSKRDKAAWRSPSHYQVAWSTPFNHVFAMDILDITLPKSGYTITSNYNTIRFRFHDLSGSPTWITASIRPGNYSHATLIAELNARMVEPAGSMSGALARRISVRPASDPFEVMGKVVFFAEWAFDIDTQSPMAPILGFSELLDATRSDQVASFSDVEDLNSGEIVMLGDDKDTTGPEGGYSLTKGKFLRQPSGDECLTTH